MAAKKTRRKKVARKKGAAPKFTKSEAKVIRSRYDRGFPVVDLASEYGTSVKTLYRVINREGPYAA